MCLLSSPLTPNLCEPYYTATQSAFLACLLCSIENHVLLSSIRQCFECCVECLHEWEEVWGEAVTRLTVGMQAHE